MPRAYSFAQRMAASSPFQQHSSLENNLDCEKHKYAPEYETLYDKAIMMYASKLEHGPACDVPQISEGIPVDVVDTPVLKMGWALKSTKEYKRLSEKQKKYLLAYVVCCYSECISHTRQAEKSA